jgi:hypothetical protein
MVGPVGVGTVGEEVEVTLVALVEVPDEALTEDEDDTGDDVDELAVVEDAEIALYA